MTEPHATPPADIAARRVLEERARELARPVEMIEPARELAALAFTVTGGAYAVALENVVEVVPAAEISRLPWAPAALAGMTNVRGQIIPVVDTARILAVGETACPCPVVIVDAGGHTVGLAVSVVDDVVRIPAASVTAPALTTDPTSMTSAVVGVTPDTTLLDPAIVLRHPELSIFSQEEP